MADEVQAAGVFELRAEGGDFRAEIADLTEVAKRFERATVDAFQRAGKAASDTAALEASSKRYISAIEREALATERKTAALVLSAAEMRRAEAAGRGESANAAAAIARLEEAEKGYASLAAQMQQMKDINVFGEMLAKSTALGQVEKNIDSLTAALDRLQAEARDVGSLQLSVARVNEDRTREAADSAAFGMRAAKAQELARAAEYVNFWTTALDAADAKEKELADFQAFNNRLTEAAKLNQAAEYVQFWGSALDVLEAKERELAAVPLFEKEKAAADKLRRTADATAAFTQLLDQLEAQEKKLASDNAFVDALQRRANAIDKTQSELLELEAAERGVSAQAAPFIAAMRAKEVSLGMYSAGARDARVQTNQMRTALSQLPMQFTDIFTSLAGGQNPLLVLIQQGGQIKDSFGGIGPALRGMGGAISAAFTPLRLLVGGAVAAVGAFTAGVVAGERESGAFRQALTLTGNAAGTTTGQLQAAAEAVTRVVGTQSKAAETIAALAETGRVAAADIDKLAEAAIRLEIEGGPAVKDTVAAFAELGKAPTQGALKLNESTRFLTISVLEQIKALEEQGRVAEAARVAQNAYADESISRAKQLESQLGTLEMAWREIAKAAKGAWDAVLDIGREDSLSQKLASIENRLSIARRLAEGGGGLVALGGERWAAGLEEERRAANRSALNAMERSTANVNVVDEAYVKAAAAVKKWGDESLTAAQKAEKAIKDYRREVEVFNDRRQQAGLPGLSAADQAKQEKAIRDSFKEREKAAKAESTLLAELSGLSSTYTKDLKELQAQRDKGNLSEARYVELVGALIQKQPFARDLARDRAAAEKDAAKAQEEYTKAVMANAAEMAKNEANEETALQRLRDEYVELTAGKDALEAQTIARLELAAAIREQAAAQALIDGGQDSGLVAESLSRQAQALREQIALRRANQGARQDNELAEANKKAADAAAEDWKRTTDSIRDGLTDAFRRAFESGEDFGTAMAKTIESELKARIATGLSGLLAEGVMMLFGIGDYRAGSSNGVAGGSGSLWQSASTASSLYNTGSNAYGWYTSGGTVANTYGQYMAGYQGSSAMMGAGTVGPVTNGAAGATGAGSSTASAMSTIGPYAIAAIAYAIGADQMADWSLHLGGYSEARRNGVRNIAADIPGSNPLDEATIAGMAEQGVYIPSVQKLSDGMATALFGFADKFATSVKATSPIEATQVVFESDRANDSWGQVKFLGAGNRELASTGMLSDLNWDANVAAPQLVTRSAAAFSTAMQESDAAQWVKDSLAKIPAELERITPDIVKQFEDPLEQAQAVNQALVGMLDGISATFAQLDNLDEQLGVLGGAFGQLAAMSSDARYALVLAAGGMEQFQKQTMAYVGNFYTDAEKTALTLDAVGRTLSEVGLSLPATRDGFRDLVDSQDLSTESGRKAYAALMSTADAFASVTESARAATDILNERAALERELLTLQGDTVELRNRDRAQLDESNRALFDQVRALEDKQALQSAIDSNAVKFMSPEKAKDYQYGTIARDLQAAGLFGDWADFGATLKDATKDEIYAVAAQFLELSNVSADAKIAMVEAAGALADLKDSAGSAADELPNLIDQFLAGLRSSDLSPLSFSEQLSVSSGLFESTLAGAKAGDADARQNLIGNAQAYLEEARAFFGSSMDYANIFARVTTELDAIGAPSADPQVQAIRDQVVQLEAMRSSVDGLATDSGTRADTQIDLARAQIAELQNVVQTQADTNAALAAGNRALWDQLEALNARVQRLLENAQLEATSPS